MYIYIIFKNKYSMMISLYSKLISKVSNPPDVLTKTFYEKYKYHISMENEQFLELADIVANEQKQYIDDEILEEDQYGRGSNGCHISKNIYYEDYLPYKDLDYKEESALIFRKALFVKFVEMYPGFEIDESVESVDSADSEHSYPMDKDKEDCSLTLKYTFMW